MNENYTSTGKSKITKNGRLINFYMSTEDEQKLHELCKVMHRTISNTLREVVHLQYQNFKEKGITYKS